MRRGWRGNHRRKGHARKTKRKINEEVNRLE